AFTAKPKLIEPFKKIQFVKKSPWLKLIKEANFYLGPKSFSFNNDLNRMYNERQNRNALDTNFVFLPTFYKTFTWVRAYNFKYDITKNLNFTFVANNNSIVREPNGLIDGKAEPGTSPYNNYLQFNDIIKET